IVDFDADILAKVLQGNLRAKSGAKIPHFVGPALEFKVVRDSSFQSNRFELGPAWRFATRARVPSFAMLHHLRAPLEGSDFANTSHVASIPLHPKLKVLVRVEPCWVDSKLCHIRSPRFQFVRQSAGS